MHKLLKLENEKSDDLYTISEQDGNVILHRTIQIIRKCIVECINL